MSTTADIQHEKHMIRALQNQLAHMRKQKKELLSLRKKRQRLAAKVQAAFFIEPALTFTSDNNR